MCADEKLGTAINHAKAFDHSCESYSDVYKVFELLGKIKRNETLKLELCYLSICTVS